MAWVARWYRVSAARDQPWHLRAASRVVIGATGILSHGIARYAFGNGGVTIDGAERLHDAARAAATRGGAPLITVANHHSVLDDPVVITLVSPDAVLVPRRTRWIPATREILFASRARAWWFGPGQCVPIERDVGYPGGLAQPGLRTVAQRLAGATGSGSRWAHVFPEGRICQKGLGRAWDHERAAYLRWGVGKLAAWTSLASSPLLAAPSFKPPVILPFYHMGMASALPLCRETNRSLRTLPKRGGRLRVKVGAPVAVADLLEAFDDMADTGGGGSGGLAGRRWEDAPTDAEKRLYAAIARRCQEALAGLARDCGAGELERAHGGYDVWTD